MNFFNLNNAIILHIINLSYSITWNFSSVGLSNDVLIWKFTLWQNRLFLAIPRWREEIKNGMTLLEVPWTYPEIGLWMDDGPPLITAFPNSEVQMYNDTNCNNLLSITGLDVDTRGRLWILDSPENAQCPPKIVYFNLRKNVEIGRSNLMGIPKKGLRTLVVDRIVSVSGYCGYIGDPGDESIIIYNIGFSGHQKWWKLRLHHGPDIPRIYTGDLAISRKNSRLYITGTMSLNLFSIELETLRKFERPKNKSVVWHGSKMGISSGLACDSKGGLHYFLINQYASVRWDTRYDLKAENHEIILQNEQVKSITDYLLDSLKNMWGLGNLVNIYQYTHYAESVDNITTQLLSRVIEL